MRVRFKFDKIIRDKLPSIMHLKGKEAHLQEVDRQKYIQKLKEKLSEETSELLEARDKNGVEAELADILEVLHAFSKVYDIPFEDVEKHREQKREEKGGFEAHVVCAYVELDATHPDVPYYQSRPQHYPAIESWEQ
ncbi:MAG: nucleoside triphosphate pyrophosphohydrolase [Alphaproteobacteria bacterium]|nr:nucleoside triphosphate pyrophosphohydrolase [Alphaproteobacteria bacterium]